jgi:putative Holliday junction resolvase
VTVPARFLGIDVGTRRVGLATGEAETGLAQPLATVAPNEVRSQIEAHGPFSAIIVGLPRGLDGQDTAQTLAVRRWVDDILGELEAIVVWQDEAGTSGVAEAILKDSGRKYAREEIDAQAAALILQDYLDELPA